ncbi:MAG TPA: 4-hydroxy-tetrahydrodipicolinate synthase [Gammaproteobacteria bacterium]|nr:4-hydroxy-tetrahydrodipicolinate synthase [Gammaproteobacteria bacterium]
MFAGSIVALVTPMHESGEVNLDSFKNLIQWHLEAGTHGIVVNGTTGESATLTSAEKLDLLNVAVETVAGKIPVIAGTGTSCTATTIQETRMAASCGVNACIVVTPYYNRPTQQGLYEHYKAVAESTELPILVYNVPRRTGCDVQPATLASMAHLKNIVGIKEATGDIMRVAAIKALSGDRFILLSGDDETALNFMRKGGNGVISVTANIAPELMQQMCTAALTGDYVAAAELNEKLALLHVATMAEPNPIPSKWALHKMGKIPAGIRLPLTTLSQPLHAMMEEALAKGINVVTDAASSNVVNATGR